MKKEIEIVKSNLIISNEKELLHKKTIQRINKINKEKEKSYKNSMSLIDDYKKRENDLMIKIKEYESDFNKKEEELNNEMSILKKELFQKNKIINELQLNIKDLNKQILNLKKLLSEKTKILSLITKKHTDNLKAKKNYMNDNNCIPYLATSKSCKNLDFKNDNKNEMTLIKRDNSLNNLKSYIMNKNAVSKIRGNNSLKFYQDSKNNNESYADNIEGLNDDNFVMHKRKNSFYKKLIPNKSNVNSIRIQTLKKNNSYRNINYKSVYSAIKKNQNSLVESSSSMNNNNSLSGITLIQYKNSLDKKQIKQFKIKKDILSQWTSKENKELKKNNITEYNNYSFKLNDGTNIHKIFSNKKIINDGDIGKKIEDNNKIFSGKKISIIDSISNTKIKNECKKNRIIEINKFLLNNPNIISNSSYRNVSYENQK